MNKIIVSVILAVGLSFGGMSIANAATIPPGPYKTNQPVRVKPVCYVFHVSGRTYSYCNVKSAMPIRKRIAR